VQMNSDVLKTEAIKQTQMSVLGATP